MTVVDAARAVAHRFPPADGILPAVATDLAGLAMTMALRFAEIIGEPTSVRVGDARSGRPSHAFALDGVGTLLVAVPSDLAAALVSRRHGGPFASDVSQIGRAGSVARCAAELADALADAARSGWEAAAPARAIASPLAAVPLVDLVVAVGSAEFGFGVALVGTERREPAASFGPSLARAIGAIAVPVGAQLFETRVALGAVARLQAGGLLPMTTPQLARLRAAGVVVASATVTNTESSGPRLTICDPPHANGESR